MSSMQVLGLASGTDWNSIINQLVQVERQPLDKLYTERAKLQLRQQLMRRASERLQALSRSYSTLRFESTFLSRTASSSDKARVGASAQVGAQTGTYNVEVFRLARASRVESGLDGSLFSRVANLSQSQTMGINALQPNGSGFQPTRALPSTLIKDTLQAGKNGALITAGDTISITGNLKGGGAVNATFTFAGDSTDTLQRLATTIATAFQGEVGASVGSNGELVFLETNPAAAGDIVFNPALNLVFNDADFSGSTLNFAVGNNVAGAGAAARSLVHSVTFTSAGVPELNAATDLASLDNVVFGSLNVGDAIQISGLEASGTTIAPVTFTYTGLPGGQTIQDLVNTISGAFASATASYSNGRIVLTDDAAGTSVTSIGLSFVDSGASTQFELGSFFVAEPGRANQAQMVTTAGFTIEGTGEHLLSSSNGRAGRITGSIPITNASNTLSSFLGVTDFASFTIDVDGPAGSIGPRTISGLSSYSTVQDFIDAVNTQVPAVTAQLRQSGSNYFIELLANDGGRDIRLYDSANGIMQGIFMLAATDIASSTNDGVNSFAATSATSDVTIVDWFQPDNGGPRQRRAHTGVDSASVSTLIGGVTITSTGFSPGVATALTTNSVELNTTQAMRSYLFGSKAAVAAPPGTLPFLRANVPLSQAGFATAPLNASASPLFHTDGVFTINGVQINVGDVNTTTLNQVIGAINASGAGVTAFFDAANARIYLRNNSMGSQPISLGASGDSSNFLRIAGLLPEFGGVSVAGREAGTVRLDLPIANSGFTTGVSSGVFTINGVHIAIDAGVDTLQDVLNKIDKSGAGVKAVYDSTGDRIILTQVLDEHVTASQIQLGDPADTSNFLEAANLTVNTNLLTAVGSERQTAEFSINGNTYVRKSNEISDIVDKVSFTLNALTSGPVAVAVEADTNRIQDGILDFVVEWNTTMELLNAKSLSREERQRTAPLTDAAAANMSVEDIDNYNRTRQDLLARDFFASDSTTRNVINRLQNLLMGTVTNSGLFRSLSDIGLTTSEIGGGVAAAQVSQGRLLAPTKSREELADLMKTNTALQEAIASRSEDLFALFATALQSQYIHSSSINLGNGLGLSAPLQFSISDGTRSANISFNAGTTSAGQVLNTINGQLLSSGLSSSMVAYFDAQNRLNLRVTSTASQARLQIHDLSTGSASLLGSIGWQSGLFLGPQIDETGGVALRSRRYVDNITGIGGIVLERIKVNGTYDRQIEVFTQSISRAEDRLFEYERRLRRKFARLETQLSRLQTQSAAIERALAQQSAAQGGNSSS